MEVTLDFASEVGLTLEEISPGGGFAIAYTRDQQPPSVGQYADAITSTLKGAEGVHLVIEPGRRIVGTAGVALYSVGASKDVPGIRKYVSVDGGMGDNIRPALYEAQYEAVLANRMDAQGGDVVSIAGKFCESGDVLAPRRGVPRAGRRGHPGGASVGRVRAVHGQQLQPGPKAGHCYGERRPGAPHPPTGDLRRPDAERRGLTMWQVVGHESAIALLSRSLEREMLSHAYVFVGPSRVGKTTLALNLAQGVNCLDEPANAAVRRLRPVRPHSPGPSPGRAGHRPGDERGRHSRPRDIGIDQVREAQRAAVLKPYEGRWRVFIFQEAASLSQEASNALLKLLEEPPESVLLILLTSSREAIPDTILSRCQQVDFRALPIDAIARHLAEKLEVPQERATELARLSGGKIGWAIEAAGNPEMVEEYTAELEGVSNLLDNGLEERFAFAEEVASLYSRDWEKALGRLKVGMNWWRDVLLIKSGHEELVSSAPAMEDMRRHAGWLSTPQVVRAINATRETMEQLEANVNPRLSLDVLMLSLPRREG